MLMISMIWILTLTALVAVFPYESMEFSAWLWLEIRMAGLNARFCLTEWMIYRKLKRDFGKFGIEIPPFVFTPLQERNSR